MNDRRRNNPGRPPTLPQGCRKWTVRVTDMEKEVLKAKIKELRRNG